MTTRLRAGLPTYNGEIFGLAMNQPDASDALIELSDVRKSYNIGLPSEAEVLHGLSMRVDRGEFIALIGPSGSGKSTLLNIVGLLERMSSGSYRLQGEAVNSLDDADLTRRRRTTLGFVFQFHHLLPAFTALENVTLPALMSEGRVSAQQLARARELLDAVGLSQAMNKRPAELSGGMQQRVAIARALVQGPALVLADEPTGNLDTASSDEVFVLLRRMHAERGTSFVVVTHDPRLAARCDRLVELVDGRIARDEAVVARVAAGAAQDH
jgi:lipoprotein-releasing system ATP-binding protein